MAAFIRIAVPGCSLFASGWLFKDPASVPLWQIDLGLFLGAMECPESISTSGSAAPAQYGKRQK